MYAASATAAPCQAPVAESSVMTYYTPSALAIERSPPIHDSTPTLVCLSCGDTMKHFRTISKFGVRPEQLIFVCFSCKEVGTMEVKRSRKGASVGTPSIK